MLISEQARSIFEKYVVDGDHGKSDYFSLIRKCIDKKRVEGDEWQKYIDLAYELLRDEILENKGVPVTPVKFGTSGWRGYLGKDVFQQSAALVTAAIAMMYTLADQDKEFAKALGITSFEDAKQKGAVVGFDNRFAGPELAAAVVGVLRKAGFTVHYAGESSTGVLSAAVMELGAAFSINLTPSHNPLEYGGFKYNAADAGPAEPLLTNCITQNANTIIDQGGSEWLPEQFIPVDQRDDIHHIDSLQLWKNLVIRNRSNHGLDYDDIIERFAKRDDIAVVIDSVHGASRLHIEQLFKGIGSERLTLLRSEKDVTFGGIAPEPSSINMQMVSKTLAGRKEKFKLGAIIDPDADRIRFTDGVTEISMNHFGAMAYHFLYTAKEKRGLVAKTVATSNMANAIAAKFGEEVFETRVGFKEFKPVIGQALVCYEESDGISIIGHTPEKDAYIGLLLALDMVMTTGKNLGQYKHEMDEVFGAYYPGRDGLEVSLKGDALLAKLSLLDKYGVGSSLEVGSETKIIKDVIMVDGHKMIFQDNSWLLIRPSGTEPKVRFYVESRDAEGTRDLVETAKRILRDIDVID